MFLLLLALLSLSFFFLLLTQRGKHNPKKQLPSPTKLPIIGNLHQITSPPHRSLRTLAQKHGPIMLLHMGPHPTVVVSSADAAKEIMKTHDLAFSSRPPSVTARRLMYHDKDMAFTPYGEYWRQVRKICVLQLLSSKQVESFRPVREEEVTDMMDRINGREVVNLSEMLVTLTNNIICRVCLGKKYSGEEVGAKRFRQLLREFLKLLAAFHLGDYFPSLAWIHALTGLDARIKKNFEEWDDFLEKVIEEHLESEEQDGSNDDKMNFVDVLLEIQKEDKVGISLTRDHVKALIQDMFAAGTDTIYTVLEWTMAELIRHPRVMRKVQEEIRRMAGGKLIVSEDDIDQMNYLKSVIKESLRLHPPLPLLVARESIGDVKIQDYHVPAKTRAVINAWAIGRDPSSWEEPEEFRPERFMNSNTPIDFRGQDFQLIPFGAGRRGCPGILFAAPTIHLALANLLHRFDWELPNAARGEDLDMTEVFGMTVHKNSSLVLAAKPYF